MARNPWVRQIIPLLATLFLVAAPYYDPAEAFASGEKRPSSYLVATADEDMPPGVPPAQLSPGGDFGWVKKSFRWGTGGGEGGGGSPGERHGDNIVANDYRVASA